MDRKITNVMALLDELLHRYPVLTDTEESICRAYKLMKDAYENGGKLLIAGNGGSAADSEHIVGELMKGFVLPRKLSPEMSAKLVAQNEKLGKPLAEKLQGGLPAIALDGHIALTTAFANDADPQMGFAQQLLGYGTEKDVFLGISTSGNSRNILYAAVTAKAKGMKVIGLTGKKDSQLSEIADVTVQVPETETYKIQELHLPVYHCWCRMLEEYFFGD